MSKQNLNLLELDVEKLFEDYKIEDIIEIEKLLDTEIEKKRIELRSMVGDRYKDVLTASDEIINMKTISEEIVSNIQKITDKCEILIDQTTKKPEKPLHVDVSQNEERSIVIQIRLLMLLNEHLWLALDTNDYSTAAQYYLLARHIHTGLSLAKKEYTEKLLILSRIIDTTESLKCRILKNVKKKLQGLTLNAQEVSNNLIALVLLENLNGVELLHTFMEHRTIALFTVINSSYSTVRIQISSMVRCLLATVHLLHDCFISCKDSENGLIQKCLENIINENSSTTLSKIELPSTPLLAYIPSIVTEFRPKCIVVMNIQEDDVKQIILKWLEDTTKTIAAGLKSSLEPVTNLTGLHIIREEALKIELPEEWEKICIECNLPENFSAWYYFFQAVISKRAETIISKKVEEIVKQLHLEIKSSLEDTRKLEASEIDLRSYLWNEESGDMSHTENKHLGLSMKTKGFSPNVVQLCTNTDDKYLELLKDTYMYLYGKQYDDENMGSFILKVTKEDKKFTDRNVLENHLRLECMKNSEQLTLFIEDYLHLEYDNSILVGKSLICARFLSALTVLCPHFNKCCAFNSVSTEWTKICSLFNRCSFKLWQHWVRSNVSQTEHLARKLFESIETRDMLQILPKWETIEIQEQTEENVFKSQIKLPSQTSLPLQQLLTHLNFTINSVLPHTIPKQIHLEFIEKNIEKLISQYNLIVHPDLTQTQALQFLFDVKFITTLCIPRENMQLVSKSQKLCDDLRSKIDPFDLDVFYSHLQNNVKRCVYQSQVLLGCLLPSSGQLASLGVSEKSKEQEREPSVLAVSVPSTTSWFPLLPVTVPAQKVQSASQQRDSKPASSKASNKSPSKQQEFQNTVRSGAAALFSGLTTDWFS